MRGTRGIVLALLLTVLTPLMFGIRVAGDAMPPSVTEAKWTPRYPIHPSSMVLSAHVTDPDGVAFVQATWCANPPFVCTYPELTDPDADGYYTNTTSTTFAGAEGASYEVYARDTLGNEILTPKYWALFVTSLDLTLLPSVVSATPGATVAVNGTAAYNGNESAPAEGVSVALMVDSTVHRATVDANGSFSVVLSAPTTEGSYPMDASATDRNLMGQAHGTLSVSTVPMPDLTIENVVRSTDNPIAGRGFSVSFDIVNVGTADVAEVPVIVKLAHGTTNHTLLVTGFQLNGGGGRHHEIVPWTPEEGAQTLWIIVDPNGTVAELSESNNVRSVSLNVAAPPPPAGISPLAWVGVVGGIAAVGSVTAVVALRQRRKTPPDGPEDDGKGF